MLVSHFADVSGTKGKPDYSHLCLYLTFENIVAKKANQFSHLYLYLTFQMLVAQKASQFTVIYVYISHFRC